jgi:hypothetical protein
MVLVGHHKPPMPYASAGDMSLYLTSLGYVSRGVLHRPKYMYYILTMLLSQFSSCTTLKRDAL